MTCPAILTGQAFLATALSHIDCQSQSIGAYGYGALANSGSTASLALSGLLTLFVALFGVRLLLGYPVAGRDLVSDVLKLAIVVTLATSWPAWRVLGYDLVINGPGQVARAIGLAAGLPGSGGDLGTRLQRVDEALAALNIYGSGRLGVATGDWFQLGLARSAFLTGTLAPLALVRLTAGILLAVAPLMAGLLLFGVTRSLFAGWAKGLIMAFLGSLSLTLVLGAELALIEPWLQDALDQRAADQKILDAPTEVVVITLAFALISIGVIAVMSRIAFHPSSWIAAHMPAARDADRQTVTNQRSDYQERVAQGPQSRAMAVATAVSENQRREQHLLESTRSSAANSQTQRTDMVRAPGPSERGRGPDALGSSYRRASRRVSQSGARRDSSQ
jgi:type IV secretion system protein VirB6